MIWLFTIADDVFYDPYTPMGTCAVKYKNLWVSFKQL